MLKDVFAKVQAAIDAIPEGPYAAEDWGQLDYYEGRPPVTFPCVLYDICEATYTNRSMNAQDVRGKVRLRIADYRPTNVSSKSPDALKIFKMYDLFRNVYVAVQGLSGETFSPLTRTSLQRVYREDGIREFLMDFEFEAIDNDAVKRTKTVKRELALKFEKKVN